MHFRSALSDHRFLNWLCIVPLIGMFLVSPLLAEGPYHFPVEVEEARFPLGTSVEVLDEVKLYRLNETHIARRYRCTAAPRLMQTSCQYTSGTYETKTAKWELSVFDDPDGESFAQLKRAMLKLHERRKAEWLARWGSLRKDWDRLPSLLPPLVLCVGPAKSPLVVIYAEGRFWEWTFQGFEEGGSAFGNGNLPQMVLYGDNQDKIATHREGFSAMKEEFSPLYLTVP